jgi:radical SAM superfamily enzyme YgiQ (UPF0313 family)
VQALLISTYDLGRQPLGLASPAASLRQAGVDVRCVDTSREPLLDEVIEGANLIAFYLPMHTATRLAGPLIDRVRLANPTARVAAYGLYAPLNSSWLRERGVERVIGPEAESELVELACGAARTLAEEHGAGNSSLQRKPLHRPAHVQLLHPDRAGLLPLARYAALQMPDGTLRVTGSTDATRGCKHLCRHCPIVPVYGGTFRAIPLDVVMADVRSQVTAGAQHITFGDPDFFNGPTHARRLVQRLHREFPSVTYDVTIKIEHLLAHSEMLLLLRDTGCLFITSAVESVDDRVLEKLRKGHTRSDFARAVSLCRDDGVALSPTFVPFTPWTTVESYIDLLRDIESLELIDQVAPIQLAIRLLVTAQSRLLELEEVRRVVDPFDADSLTWPWRHPDPVVDALHRDAMRIVATGSSMSRGDLFGAIVERAYALAGRAAPTRTARSVVRAPMMTEAWYCCAEPMEFHM